MRISNKLSVRSLSYILLFIPLIPLEGLYYIQNAAYNLLYLIGTLAVALAVILRWVYSALDKKKINYAILVMLLMAVYNILVTVFKHGDLKGAGGVWLYTIPLLMLADLNRKRLDVFLKAALFYLEFLIVVNFLLTLVFPDGMYNEDVLKYGKMWLLGYKSTLQCYVFPAAAISLLLSAYENSYKNTLFLLVVSHLVCITESNGMLLMGLALIDVVVLAGLYKKNRFSKRVLVVAAIAIIAANIIVVLFTSSFLSNSVVHYITYNILGKDATLSMRTSNWQAVIPAIKANPVIGYGYTTAAQRQLLYGRETAHAHNIFLELLYEGGLIEFCCFIWFNSLVFKRIYRNFNRPSARVIFYLLAVFYVMYIFENVFRKTSSFIWLIFLLGYFAYDVDAVLSRLKS